MMARVERTVGFGLVGTVVVGATLFLRNRIAVFEAARYRKTLDQLPQTAQEDIRSVLPRRIRKRI